MHYDIIPFTDVHIGGANLTVIGGRPQAGRTLYIIHWLKKYANRLAKSKNKPYFIFVNKNDNILLNYTDIDTLNSVNRLHLKFGDYSNFIPELTKIYNTNPPFVFIHCYEMLFHRYSTKNNVDDLPNSILAEIKNAVQQYKIPTVITTHVHTNKEGLWVTDLEDFGSSTFEIIPDEVFILNRPGYYGIKVGQYGEDVTNTINLIHLKGRKANLNEFRIGFDIEKLRLKPANLIRL